jgi:hypothetical protein
MPSARFKHGFRNDVFLSYAHVDDLVDPAGWMWVSKFETDLRNRLEMVSGKSIVTFRDSSRLASFDRIDSRIEDELRNSAVLVAIVSPAYFSSEYCSKERLIFHEIAPDVGGRARIVQVAKTRVDRTQYPEDLRSLNENKFYIDTPKGFRDLHLHEDKEVRELYASRVDDVAQEISERLNQMEPNPSVAVPKGTVFLAETSSDLDEPRLQIRRSLLQLGYNVLPESPLRFLSAPDLAHVVQEDLSRVALTIHPVGARYGLIPELEKEKSVVRLQLEYAAGDSRNGSLPRIVWLPAGIKPAEERQQLLISDIQTHWAGKPFQIVEGTLEKFQTELPIWLPSSSPRPSSSKRRPSVYVLCFDESERRAARALRTFLNSKNVDVGSASPSAEGHAKRLANDDGFVIFFGNCSDEWVYQKIDELVGAQTARTESGGPLRVVFLADPKRIDKEEFLSNDAEVVCGFGSTIPENLFAELLPRLQRSIVSPTQIKTAEAGLR